MNGLDDVDWEWAVIYQCIKHDITIEELYQAFKERLMTEIAAAHYAEDEDGYSCIEKLDLVDKEQK